MLELREIVKIYDSGDTRVEALKGVSLRFRDSEFVSILGPSGCGKTTLLNIIGGLDRYTSGDLIINGRSTKQYGDRDWDTYRNHSIGFVFQSYNLIPHQTILENVELALSIGGIPKGERRSRAVQALESVGLGKMIRKKPNQLSGGQMQRVAIARALVTNPDIILADEPTGALDTDTGVQVMELLKEVARDRLVIMVTHNPDLAERYSTRIVRMLDGEVVDDSAPVGEEEVQQILKAQEDKAARMSEVEKKRANRRAAMSMKSSVNLSFKNLLSKKSRTFITSFASSIGIIGVAAVLSVSNGMSDYVDNVMAQSTSTNYIAITDSVPQMYDFSGGATHELTEYPENTTGILPYEEFAVEREPQELSEEYLRYLEETCRDYVIGIDYAYDLELNVLAQKEDGSYVQAETASFTQILDNSAYIAEQYTVLAAEDAGHAIPTEAGEVTLVVDSYNRLSTAVLDSLGISYTEDLQEISYDNLIGREFKVVLNDAWYTADTSDPDQTLYRGASTQGQYARAYQSDNTITLRVISVLREKEDASAAWISEGIGYTPALTQAVYEANKESAVVAAQLASPDTDVTTGRAFPDEKDEHSITMGDMMSGGSQASYQDNLAKFGYSLTPSTILIYPSDFDSKDVILDFLDEWNASHEDDGLKVEYTDVSSVVSNMLGDVIDIITYALIAFSAISLVVSSVMIAILTYSSVIERIREIGILRAMGARKKDIARVFKAEASMIGLTSGVIAVIAALGICAVANRILDSLVGVNTIASMSPFIAVCMILLSWLLTWIASLIPAKMAAKKDPVVALRSE